MSFPVSNSDLIEIINECNKQYFITKHQYLNQREEIEELMSDQVNLFDLIDTQHTLIKELELTVKSLYEELSFRKLIIERKDRILKELNSAIINKFIDKLYSQELIIAELQKECSLLKKYKSNAITAQFPETHQWNIQPIINNITTYKSVPINVIVPKSKNEYNGTLSFVNSSKKNFDKFINVKGKKDTKHQGKLAMTDISKRKNNQSMSLRKLHMRSKTQVDSIYVNPQKEIMPFAYTGAGSNRSINQQNSYQLGRHSLYTQTGKIKSSLLNNSYDRIKRFKH